MELVLTDPDTADSAISLPVKIKRDKQGRCGLSLAGVRDANSNEGTNKHQETKQPSGSYLAGHESMIMPNLAVQAPARLGDCIQIWSARLA